MNGNRVRTLSLGNALLSAQSALKLHLEMVPDGPKKARFFEFQFESSGKWKLRVDWVTGPKEYEGRTLSEFMYLERALQKDLSASHPELQLLSSEVPF